MYCTICSGFRLGSGWECRIATLRWIFRSPPWHPRWRSWHLHISGTGACVCVRVDQLPLTMFFWMLPEMNCSRTHIKWSLPFLSIRFFNWRTRTVAVKQSHNFITKTSRFPARVIAPNTELINAQSCSLGNNDVLFKYNSFQNRKTFSWNSAINLTTTVRQRSNQHRVLNHYDNPVICSTTILTGCYCQ